MKQAWVELLERLMVFLTLLSIVEAIRLLCL
jgi:hypothetical protein